jgi:hypothetical protein
MEEVYQWPVGPASKVDVAFAAVMPAAIDNSKTLVTIVGNLTSAATINLTVDEKVPVGSTLTVKTTADGTGRTLTFGTGFTAAAYAVGVSKSVKISFEYDGTTFVQSAAPAVLN